MRVSVLGSPRRLTRRVVFVAVGAVALLLASAAVAQATTFTVNVTSDGAGAGDCGSPSSTNCSLRQAVAAAVDGDTINIPNPGTYSLTQGTIDISHSIVITGAGANVTNIDGTGNSSQTSSGRLFKVLSGTVAFQDLSLNGGNDTADENCCGDTFSLNGGGALFNSGGTVALIRVSFLNDRSFLGGAVSNNATLTMTDVSFTNDGGGIGGGVFTKNGTVNGTNVTFENDATGANDTAAAYLFSGTVSLINSTVVGSGGASSRGGGIDNHGAALTLAFDTLANNTRGSLETDQGAATTTVSDSIIANGFSGGDSDCIAPGLATVDGTSGNAITTNHDGGHNLDQDNSCGLSTANGDIPGQDPKLLPIFGNGGATDTEALLAGSPALDAASSACPDTDERGISRPQGPGCDIGAFEAQRFGNPIKAATGAPEQVTDNSAILTGTINLAGEAGGYHFVYGTSPDQLTSTAAELPAGILSSDFIETEQISDLNPRTTYYYKVVADNASGSLEDSGAAQHFTTAVDPPSISNLSVTQVTDTTAHISFTLNDGGASTHYSVAYGRDMNYGSTGPSGQLPARSGPTQEQGDLAGLSPNATYHFHIVATNGTAPDADTGDQTLATAQQITGSAGSPTQVADAGNDGEGRCPTATVDWGDGSLPDNANTNNGEIQCSPGSGDSENFALTDQHTYATTGHYTIQISYSDGQSTTEYAQIRPPRPSVTNVTPAQGPATGGTRVTITGSGFTGVTTVNFGDSSARDFQFVSDTQITATAPAENPQTVDVVVGTPNGESAQTPTDHFTFAAPPVVTGIDPASGPAGGGTTVTINGSGFTNASVVKFGNANATITQASDAQLVVVAPAGSAGTVDITVTAPGGTSATGPADKFTYTQVTPPPNTSSPQVTGFTPSLTGANAAGVNGEVNPGGLPTTAYYVYGLDARYQPTGVTTYDSSTPKILVGSDFANHPLPATLKGLLPNALYHVRLVAVNSDGQMIGPDETFTTPSGPAPPPPSVGHENVKTASGKVFVVENGQRVPLTQTTQLPSGTVIDTLNGTISLVAAAGAKGKHYTGTFGGAVFRITQIQSGPNKGLVTLTIVEGAFPGAPSYAVCKGRSGRAASGHAALSSRILQTLRSRASGRFRTRGRYAAGTVRGTQWTTTDRCDGTLIAVQVHAVEVSDLVKHKTVLVRAGHSYLARAPK